MLNCFSRNCVTDRRVNFKNVKIENCCQEDYCNRIEGIDLLNKNESKSRLINNSLKMMSIREIKNSKNIFLNEKLSNFSTKIHFNEILESKSSQLFSFKAFFHLFQLLIFYFSILY